MSVPSVPVPQISNVVCTFQINRPVDLLVVSQRFNLEYIPRRFAAVTLRLRRPYQSTALVFTSGKVVCTGAKSSLQGLLASRLYVNWFQRNGLKFSFSQFHVQNVVASANCGYPLHLDTLMRDHADICSWENRMFPGLTMRPGNRTGDEDSLTYNVFRSGKVVIAGAKSEAQMHERWTRVYTTILKHYFDYDDPNKYSSDYRKKLTAQRDLDDLDMVEAL